MPPARKIALIDLDAGNVGSVANALEHLSLEAEVVRTPEALDDRFDRVILPGVGAFAALMDKLRARGFDAALERRVRGDGLPFLGICVGMQILCDVGLEFGEHLGLGWLPGRCVRLEAAERLGLPVPHVGWNDLASVPDEPLLAGTERDPDVYFVHSYHVEVAQPSDAVAHVEYGGPVVAAVRRGHIAGVQFHPEKSQRTGLQILKNFAVLPGAI
jgi:glutamine amidotransferase